MSYNMKKQLVACLAIALLSFPVYAQKKSKSIQPDERPNIILIMVDDMGYSDLSSYGSEIQTPHLDKLAEEGVRLTQFYNNSICAPTRASVITGQYQHKAGIGYFNVNLGLPAYQGYLNRESLTFGEVLKSGGYNTFISGKWHVGNDSLVWPVQRGFDQFYGFVGATSNFFTADSKRPVKLKRNNEDVYLPEGEYLTDKLTEEAMNFITDHNDPGKPFFLYLAYNAPHWPLQAPQEVIDKYKGVYDIGWDSLRVLRIQRQQELGLLSKTQTIAERDPAVPQWNALNYEEKQLWKTKMEVYAAMVDRVDQNVGHLLAHLKKVGKYENTLIVFISDNGPQAGYRGITTFPPSPNRGFRAGGAFTGPIGSPNSYGFQDQPWAHLSKTPLRDYKDDFHEGGISSPFIAWYPKKIKQGKIVDGVGHIIDLAPTFYELAGVTYPEVFQGIKPHPLPGKSLLPVIFGDREVVDRGKPLFWERAGNRAVRDGKWKLVSAYPSYQWELYDISLDRGETKNLAAENPGIVNRLAEAYYEWAKTTGVEDYDKIKPQRQINVRAATVPPAQ